MMKKRLSKTLWYGSDIDKEGKPVLPPLAKEANDLEGIHEGELYLHLGDGSALLFTRSADGQVVQLGSNADELANYLLKSVWDKAFEIRTTENGEEYLLTKLNLATQYGITMYANGGLLDLPNIFEGIPFDNKTIWLNPETKLVEVIGSTEEDEGSADFSNVKTSGEGNAFTSFVLSEDGKELTFVKGETFAKQSDFAALNIKVTDFLEGSDTDNIINKWKELEAFLSGMKESDDLATILATKWTKDDAKIANWDAAFGWGDHSKAGYMKKSVIYDDSLKCWKLDGDLLVTGGITMYANEGKYTPSTITDAVNIDNDTLVRVNGVIMLNPDIEFGGGVADSIAWSNVTGKPTWIGNNKPSYTTSEVTEGTNLYFTNARAVSALGDTLEGYLPLTGGTITGDLRLRKGSEYTSPYLYFGDSDEVWMKEAADTHLTIHADGSVIIDADLIVKGGITMYANEGDYTPSTIMDAVSVDGQTIIKRNGVLMLNPDIEIGGGGGGIDSITKQMVIDALGFTPYDEDNPDGFITGITKTMVTTALGYTPYDSTNPNGFITGITKSMVTTALGFTPYNATNPNGYVTSSGSVAYATSAGSAEDADYATTSGACSGNAATATTLKTSRTIWGKSFNGSGNVSGNLKLGSSNLMMESDNSYGDSSWAIFAYGPTLQFKYGSSGGSASTMALQISKTNGEMRVFGDIIPSSNSTYNLGSSSNNWKAVFANSVTFGNGVSASIKTKGWYRFATTINAENVAGGGLIFSIRRQYNSHQTESYVVAVAVGYSGVTFTQLSGKHLSNRSDIASHAMITQVRATNYSDGNVCFDFFYEGTSREHNVYVNCIGTASLQIPTLTTDVRSYTTVFDLSNGLKVDEIYSNSYRDIAYIRRKFGKNLLTNGDTSINANNYLVGSYQCGSTVVTGRTYRITFCGKLGENNTNLALFTSNGNTHITDVLGLSRTEEKIVSLTFKMKGEHPLSFYQFPNGKFGSYIRWAYLEEEFKEGELSTTTDYNNWLAEYNKLDSRSFLHKIQRIDVGDSSYWSADKGLVMVGRGYWSANEGMVLSDASAYPIILKRLNSSGGTYIQYFANNQSTQSWASGVNNTHQFSWWYHNGTSDVQKMKLDDTGSLSSDYWKINNSSTNPYLMLTQGSTWYIQGYQGYLYLGAGNAKSMRIDSSGNVLSVGGITMYSDLRKKTILNHVELSLKEVADAPLIEHYYNSDEKKTTHVGSVAQYWAGLNDWFCKEDEEGFLTMEIQNAALASAISVARELTRYESKTDKQIKKLKKRIGELEEEIENLKKM